MFAYEFLRIFGLEQLVKKIAPFLIINLSISTIIFLEPKIWVRPYLGVIATDNRNQKAPAKLDQVSIVVWIFSFPDPKL